MREGTAGKIQAIVAVVLIGLILAGGLYLALILDWMYG